IQWTPDQIVWTVNGNAFRTVKRSDTWDAAANTFKYPDSESYISVGIWDGGSGAKGTADWAGGAIQWNKQPFVAAVKSITIDCYYNGNETTYVPPGGNGNGGGSSSSSPSSSPSSTISTTLSSSASNGSSTGGSSNSGSKTGSSSNSKPTSSSSSKSAPSSSSESDSSVDENSGTDSESSSKSSTTGNGAGSLAASFGVLASALLAAYAAF
ncbi:putative glycosidase CRH2, partial [Coemansia sp. RSA 2424]